jgi:hypothetical protein
LIETKLKFSAIVWTSMGPTGTTKNLEKGVVRGFTKKTLNRRLHNNDFRRHVIDQKTCCEKCITLVGERYRGMRKKRKPSFDNVSMFAFSRTILLVCMRTRHMMQNTQGIKKGV